MKLLIKTILLSSIIVCFWSPEITESGINTELPNNKYGWMVFVNIKAEEYKVSAVDMKKTIKCESTWNTNARNITPREKSHGLAQINLKAHTHISPEQAEDPYFAIDFMANNFSKGKARIWTCYRYI